MELTEEDVIEILKLFENSKFDFLQLEQGERKITVSKGGYVPAGGSGAAAPAAPPASRPQAAASQHAAAPQPAAKVEPAAATDGLIPVTAPMVGKFYAASSPSDPPYVEVGTKVAVGATVGLIEVMKTFTPVVAEEVGRLVAFHVENEDPVMAGQPLYDIEV